MNYYIFTVLLSLFLVTIVTRAFPFMFASKISGNTRIQQLGKRLTAYIMVLLVIYEINPVSFQTYPFGIPALISLLLVLVVHLLLHKPLLSMILGTMSFIFLSQWIG